LGWIAGELIAEDPGVVAMLKEFAPHLIQKAKDGASHPYEVVEWIKWAAHIAGAVFVLAMGALLRRRHGSAVTAH
ncbi:MAG: hypothetical protein RL291_54, partial [Pseudomonadota bacterium]